jgi:L-ascorbate metabolism protein UlaG (beta-lactamase superfamily)
MPPGQPHVMTGLGRTLGSWSRASVIAALGAVVLFASIVGAQAAVDRCLAVSSLPGVKYARHVPLGSTASAAWVRTQGQALAAPRADRLKPDEARLTFVGHSTFLIESPEGVSIATDYNDYVRPIELPDIATMNRAHSSHFTDFPSPMIKHVLRGWNPLGGPARHDIEYKDVHVRNVATNTRWGDQGSYGAYGNSIFIFQMAGLCIGHLGHLHHTLTEEQLIAIGQLDIVLVPVDGGYTLDVAGMAEVVKTLRSRLIIPMHYFNQFTLNRFLDRVKGEWPVEFAPSASIVVSQKLLPAEAKILVLPGL